MVINPHFTCAYPCDILLGRFHMQLDVILIAEFDDIVLFCDFNKIIGNIWDGPLPTQLSHTVVVHPSPPSS